MVHKALTKRPRRPFSLRNGGAARCNHSRCLRLEPLEDRCLLSVDLKMVDFRTEASQASPFDLNVRYNISGDTSSPFQIGLYRSEDGITPSLLVQTYAVDGEYLNPTDPDHPHQINIPVDFEDAPLDYYLMAKLDCYDDVAETSEGNNGTKYDGGVFLTPNRTTVVVNRSVGGTGGMATDKFAMLPNQEPTDYNILISDDGIIRLEVEVYDPYFNAENIVRDPSSELFPFDFEQIVDSVWVPAPDPDEEMGMSVERLDDGISLLTLDWDVGDAVINNYLKVTFDPLEGPDDVFYFGTKTSSGGSLPNFTDDPFTPAVEGGNIVHVHGYDKDDPNRDGYDDAWLRPATAHVFYDNSAFNPTAGPDANDVNAIDRSKEPLLPGQMYTVENYTTYDKGINGVMLDLFDVEWTSIQLDDFTFWEWHPGVGTLGAWDELDDRPPTGFDVEELGEGESYSNADVTRVTFTWDSDDAVSNGWLKVKLEQGTIWMDDSQGPHPQGAFVFGNLIGDADLTLMEGNPAQYWDDHFRVLGNPILPGQVDYALVEEALEEWLGGATTIEHPYDFDRDGDFDCLGSA